LPTEAAGSWRVDGVELTSLRPGEVKGRVARPASLARDASAYAVTIVGTSMWPRFRPGRNVAVSADSPVESGDDVLVKLRIESVQQRSEGTIPVLIKELVSRSDGLIELRQFNPDLTFEVPATEVEAVEKVLGEIL
jgi:phage repressor protein C with HTH and peptisase S24 domain